MASSVTVIPSSITTKSYYFNMDGTDCKCSCSESMGYFETRMRETSQLQLKTLDGSIQLIDKVTCPYIYRSFRIPSHHSLSNPDLLNNFVLDMLYNLNVDPCQWDDLLPQIQSFIVQVAHTYGIKVSIVADIDVVKTDVVDEKDVDWSALKVGSSMQEVQPL